MRLQKNSSLQSLLIVHRAMLMGQLIFAAIIFFLLYSNNFVPPFQRYDRGLQLVAVILSFAGFYIGTFFILKRKVIALKNSDLFAQDKFRHYRTACTLQWILLEIPCIFSGICFLLVGNYSFLALAITLIILFAMMSPTAIKIQLLLGINEDDFLNI